MVIRLAIVLLIIISTPWSCFPFVVPFFVTMMSVDLDCLESSLYSPFDGGCTIYIVVKQISKVYEGFAINYKVYWVGSSISWRVLQSWIKSPTFLAFSSISLNTFTSLCLLLVISPMSSTYLGQFVEYCTPLVKMLDERSSSTPSDIFNLEFKIVATFDDDKLFLIPSYSCRNPCAFPLELYRLSFCKMLIKILV